MWLLILLIEATLDLEARMSQNLIFHPIKAGQDWTSPHSPLRTHPRQSRHATSLGSLVRY